MNRTPIVSSQIRSAGHENGTMEIEFRSGRVYRYTGEKVTEHYNNMVKADSAGSYFVKNIRHCPHTVCEEIKELKDESSLP
jgi:hypothetical protein